MITCDEKALYFAPVMWVFELIKRAYGVDIIGNSKINIKIGIEEDADIQLLYSLYQNLLAAFHKYEHSNYFHAKPLITLENGRPDYISTIFYLANGFQEFYLPENQKDKYGRMDYKHSLQFKFDVLGEDLVKDYVQKLLHQIDSSLNIPERKSRMFVSHDIDSVYGSLKYDGLWALKKGSLQLMLKVIAKTVMLNPPWFNIDKVAKLENEYDIKACYYWIVQNGRDANGIKNGDYNFKSSKIQAQMKMVKSLGNENGLHKSTMNTDFNEELKEILNVESNRFHFLKINNPNSFKEMQESGIQSDSSIGFPYNMGFKNNFGMPYYPFDIYSKVNMKVLEIPLQIMDGMFDIKDETSSEKAFSKITNFIEANNSNAIISILWHNSEMTNFAYKWSFDCYKKLLKYFADMQFESVLPSQLVNEYESA